MNANYSLLLISFTEDFAALVAEAHTSIKSNPSVLAVVDDFGNDVAWLSAMEGEGMAPETIHGYVLNLMDAIYDKISEASLVNAYVDVQRTFNSLYDLTKEFYFEGKDEAILG